MVSEDACSHASPSNGHDPDGNHRELFAYAISAKRYALFCPGPDGSVRIESNSEHGLGLYMNPLEPGKDSRKWMAEAWRGIVTGALGGPQFEPDWGSAPAMIRSSVSTPRILERLDRFNAGLRYRNRIKPFNFLIFAPVTALDRLPEARLSHTGGMLLWKVGDRALRT